MTTAQKNNAVKFKKAIAIRKKTGCSLKEAFEQVYGTKKVGAVKKKAAPKKKVVKKIAKKKAAPKTLKYRGTLKSEGSKKMYKYSLGAVKKKAAPKKKISTHKDTKSHNVNIKVMSGVGSIHKSLRSDAEKALNNFEERLESAKKRLSESKTTLAKKQALQVINALKGSIALIKLHIKEHNKQILK